MRRWLLRILDIGSDPADDRDLAVRKRTAAGTLLVLCVANVVYLVIGLLADRPLVALFAVIQIGCQMLNLATFNRTRRPTWTLDPAVLER